MILPLCSAQVRPHLEWWCSPWLTDVIDMNIWEQVQQRATKMMEGWVHLTFGIIETLILEKKRLGGYQKVKVKEPDFSHWCAQWQDLGQ